MIRTKREAMIWIQAAADLIQKINEGKKNKMTSKLREIVALLKKSI